MDQHLLSFVVRFIHVISMSFLLGGTLLLLALAARDRSFPSPEHSRWLSYTFARFEMFFWLAIGVQLLTGIGNLGAFGATLPPPFSPWGVKLLIKLFIVLLLIVLSLVRSLVVAGNRSDGGRAASLSARFAGSIYGLTGFVVGLIVLLAVSLAHG